MISQCIFEHMGPYNSDFFSHLLNEEGRDWNFLPRPSLKESKVLYDADMINLCGPFGVAKIIYLRTKSGINFKEALESTKILAQQAFNDLQTESGKKLAKKYFSVSNEFLKMINL